jgi:uncharacterized protein (TIGR03067 family)
MRTKPRRMWIGALLLAGILLSGGAGIITTWAATAPAGAGTPPGQEKTDGANADRDKFQGTWLVVWKQQEGNAVPFNVLQTAGAKIIVQGDRMRWQVKPGAKGVAGEDAEVTIRLDPSREPKVLHGTATAGARKGKMTTAIYEFLLNGEALRICWDTRGGEKPPAEFHAGEKGSGMMLLKLVREEAQMAVAKSGPAPKPGKMISLEGVRDKKITKRS